MARDGIISPVISGYGFLVTSVTLEVLTSCPHGFCYDRDLPISMKTQPKYFLVPGALGNSGSFLSEMTHSASFLCGLQVAVFLRLGAQLSVPKAICRTSRLPQVKSFLAGVSPFPILLYS